MTANSFTTLDDSTPHDEKQLEELLQYKLSGIPIGHLPSLTLRDILSQTARTILIHIPHDIGLAWFLRHRALILAYVLTGMGNKSDREDGGDVEANVVRAVWYYRLDTVRQFQRYHDGVRWNLAIYVALLTRHALEKEGRQERCEYGSDSDQGRSRCKRIEVQPAAIRFMMLYLEAVVEHHSHPMTFHKRDEFVRLWRRSGLDLFTINKSWAKKSLQRSLKQLSPQWSRELSFAQCDMGLEAYSEKVGKFVGSLVPGMADQNLTTTRERNAARSKEASPQQEKTLSTKKARNELLDALSAPCPVPAEANREQKMTRGEERYMVCDLHTAITCVQNVTPRDMLPVLVRLFP
ncbi:hypothetical protein N0V86_000507 [Didymella sp. IMI 355093]|nr:hypothetical protein N0V86_000507 [Didymella sp. IMI 355093]